MTAASREAREIRRFRRKRLFLLSFLLALVFTAGYFAFRMATISRVTVSTKGAYGVQLFRENEKNAVKTYTVKETYFNKSTYLPLDALQEFVTVTESGDEHHRSLILPNGDQVTFDLGTPNCTVNGVRASLEAPVFLKDDVLYLPVDFFSRWMNCFTYTFSSPLDAYVLSFSGDVTPALTTRAMNATPKIDVAAKPATPAPAPAENPA